MSDSGPVTGWRGVIGHEGYFEVDLQLFDSGPGRKVRVLQPGYRATWWAAGSDGASWLGAGPVERIVGRRSLRPGEQAKIVVRPMFPSDWATVQPGAVLLLRPRPHRTTGIATVLTRVQVPAYAALRAGKSRPNAVLLGTCGAGRQQPLRRRTLARLIRLLERRRVALLRRADTSG